MCIVIIFFVGNNPNWEGRVNLEDAVAKLLEAVDGSGTEPIRMSDKESMKVRDTLNHQFHSIQEPIIIIGLSYINVGEQLNHHPWSNNVHLNCALFSRAYISLIKSNFVILPNISFYTRLVTYITSIF